MATIYSPPEEIKVPELSFKDIGNYQEECKVYIERLKEVLRKRNSAEEVGEVIRFPVADGYAEYMVASMRPVELVHLPLMDCYEFPYAKLLGVKAVREEIRKQKALKELFSKKQQP